MEQLTQKVVDTVHELYNRNKLLAQGSEDDRRRLTRMMAEQFKFDTNDPNFGVKSTGEGAPQSKDTIVYKKGGGWLNIWDWQNGTTREPQIRVGQKPDYVEQQHFIPVNPVNHLGSVNPIPVPPVEPPIPPSNIEGKLNEILNNQNILFRQHSIITRRLETIEELLSQGIKVDVKLETSDFPMYIGSTKAFGGSLTLRPTENKKNEER